MITATIEPAAVPEIDPEIEAMMEAGVHFGHARARRHPAMAPYIWGARSNVEILDLTRTRDKLADALAFLREAGREGKLVLFAGTRPAAKAIVREVGEALAQPYVNERWIGGTLTNFKVIRSRVETLERLEQEQASGEFAKYPKKEQMRKIEEIARLTKNFDGLRRLTKLPDAVVIVDIRHDDLALREVGRMGIASVALTDTNTDPRLVDYPIPANDDARPAIRYMLERIRSAILEGQGLREAPPLETGGEGPIPSEDHNAHAREDQKTS